MSKRISILVLLCCFLLSGCSLFGERIKEPVTFYYVRKEFQYFTQSDVIASETREASGHRDDLSYLLALYMMGPTDEDLYAPLLRGTSVHHLEQTGDGLTLQLTDLDLSLADTDFSLACACLAMTCMELTDTPQVTIHSGDRTMTLDREDLVLIDNSTSAKEDIP